MVIFVWLALALLAMSFIEYIVHRWPMHNKRFVDCFPVAADAFESHAVLHHGRFFKDFENEPDRAARYVSLELSPGYMLLGLSPIWGGLCFLSLTGGVLFATVIAMHGIVWTAVHREMHEPKGRWFSRMRPYRFWRAYHKRHHEKPGTNFNALLPGLDWLFGTYGGLA